MRYHVVFPFTDRAAAEEFLGEQREAGWSGVILGPEGDEIPSSRPALRVVAEEAGYSVKVPLSQSQIDADIERYGHIAKWRNDPA